jgi:hypothetical protein
LLPLVERNPSIRLTRKFGNGADIGGGRPLEDQTRRRDLMAFVGAASTLASFAAAQQPKMPAIGIVVCRIFRLRALLAAPSAGYVRAALHRGKKRSIRISIGRGAEKPASLFG